MTIASIFAVIGGVFKFWDQVTWLIKTLQGTPEEHKEALMTRIRDEADLFAKTGRPTWD